jgi:hypothetical protein
MRILGGLAVVLLALSSRAAPIVQREAQVKAVFVRLKGGKAVDGGTSNVAVRIAPNRARVPSVGVMEEFSGGTGDQWRTALWQAALVSTQATSTSLLDYEFSLRVGGFIDGPSAGLLTASTLTALIRGKRVLPNTTMTGTINPDGSSGPVGGILFKLRGAASDGITRFGFPIGGRQQQDEEGALVDLLAEGQRLGVEVKELPTLDEAYTFLTGDVLPRSPPTAETSMELLPDELAGFERMIQTVKTELDADRPEVVATLKKLNPKLASQFAKNLDAAVARAEAAAREGEPVKALFEYYTAAFDFHGTQQDARLRLAIEANDFETVAAVLASQRVLETERMNYRQEIAAQFAPTSRTNDVYAMDLLENAVATQGQVLRAQSGAQRMQLLAKKGLTSMSADERKAFSKELRTYADDMLRVRDNLKFGRAWMALYAVQVPPKRQGPAVDSVTLSSVYASAGSASQAYFEALVTAPNAAAAGVTQGQFRTVLFGKDDHYLNLVGYGDQLSREKDPRARLMLGIHQTVESAYLVNTYYALGGALNEQGQLTLSASRALTEQLSLAKTRVLQSCGRAERETGLIPLPAKIRFLNARGWREGTDREKTGALAEFWLANAWCVFAAGK